MAKNKRPALLPKRIGGVKVPKSARKGRFGELLASHTGRTLLAEAVLTEGADGARPTVTIADPGLRSFAEHIAERLEPPADREAASAALAFALGEAARVFITALDEHQKAQAKAAKASAPRTQTAGGSKQKRSSPAAIPP
ncbi:hypothetical protein LJR219_001603 [Phenylobacterium sp. LjRoot219]|uniref:hypothetical protein n=1 Tax=Phenylobacterium sp. LjRoot219 TaxID=3342283 RepID=UPI003ECCEB6F